MPHRTTSSSTFRSIIPLICLLCLLPCILAQGPPPKRFRVPGVGLSLTPDYGTAAIYFANGSIAEVAQIEGRPEYKAFMRRKEAPSSLKTSLCDAFPPTLQQATLNFCSKPPDSASVVSLLRALKYSVEAYLGTTFCFADVVIPDSSRTYQCNVIEKAIIAVGLRQTHSILNAGLFAVIANRGSWSDDKDRPERVILSVDYSRSGLNTMLFCDDEDSIDDLRQVYSPDLGAENVETALKGFVEPPFGHSPMGVKLPDHIDRLVLYGDRVSDREFLETLRRVLGTDLVENAYVFDPLFASAVGIAESSHLRMRRIDFNTKPAIGCRWRSNLYAKARWEL
ncbi:hypothetical protein H2201_000053 [Coniosporium apollinis]|uniref:Uncharacterized protein n=1 Tax=Coniosporium apollinis TaxID=61459 RepID=A0ABQ9P536_9PEZI|nr:hypothetical protein H2201_000053 [Coniosporium apollinis]